MSDTDDDLFIPSEKEISDLIEECNKAFDSFFERKINITQAVSADWLGDPSSCDEESWTHWKDIPNKALIVGSVMFNHFKLDQILFYLPAYMRLSLSLYYKSPMGETGICVQMMLRVIGRNYERFQELGLSDDQISFVHKLIRLNLKENFREYLCEGKETLEEKYKDLL